MSGRLLAAGVVISACVGFWAYRADWTGHVGLHLGLYAIAAAAYLFALADGVRLDDRQLRLALTVAAGWRLAMALAPPMLSDDVNRYVWEGRIQLHGGNPFRWADRPESDAWLDLRDSVWARVNHKTYTAIYPPVWQLAARAVVAVHDSLVAMKLFLVASEILALLTLALLLRRRGQPPGRLLIWAWSPLALVEIAGGGHNEAFGLLWLSLALLAVESGRPLASALAAALGCGSKLVPGLVAAAWARRYRVRDVVLASAVLAIAFLPFRSARQGLFRSFVGYASDWRFNETGFALLAAGVGDSPAVGMAALLLAALAAVLAWRRSPPVAAGLLVTAALLVLSPNVLPWYALWLLPYLVLMDSPPALAFTISSALAYLVIPAWKAGGDWRIGWDVRLAEYGPAYLLAWLDLRRRLAARP